MSARKRQLTLANDSSSISSVLDPQYVNETIKKKNISVEIKNINDDDTIFNGARKKKTGLSLKNEGSDTYSLITMSSGTNKSSNNKKNNVKQRRNSSHDFPGTHNATHTKDLLPGYFKRTKSINAISLDKSSDGSAGLTSLELANRKGFTGYGFGKDTRYIVDRNKSALFTDMNYPPPKCLLKD